MLAEKLKLVKLFADFAQMFFDTVFSKMASPERKSFEEPFRFLGIDIRVLLKHVTREMKLENSDTPDMCFLLFQKRAYPGKQLLVDRRVHFKIFKEERMIKEFNIFH